MRILLAFLLMITPASAAQISILCKIKNTNEFIQVVSKNRSTNDVLVQIDGGTFYDGFSSFDDPFFKVVIPFDAGSGILIYNFKKDEGGFAISINNKRRTDEIDCVINGGD